MPGSVTHGLTTVNARVYPFARADSVKSRDFEPECLRNRLTLRGSWRCWQPVNSRMTKRGSRGFPRALQKRTAIGVTLFQLACSAAPQARTHAADKVPTVTAPSAALAEPEAPLDPVADSGDSSPTKFEAAERVARSLFGKSLGPEFDIGDPTLLAPEGYSVELQHWLDFDANTLQDVVLTLNRDPDESSGESGRCVLVLGLAVDASKYVVAAINGQAFACARPAAEDGMDGTEVTFSTSEDGHELVINVAQQGHVIWENWSFQVGYDAKSSRFVLSKLFNSFYNRQGMVGGNATLYPLEGRGERVEEPATGEPEPLQASPTRVFFEDLGNEVAYKLLGS